MATNTIFCSFLNSDDETFTTIPIPELAGQSLVSVDHDNGYSFDSNKTVTQLVTDQGNMYYIETNSTKILSRPTLVNVSGTIPLAKIINVIMDVNGEYVLDVLGNLYFRAIDTKAYKKYVIDYPVVSLAKTTDELAIVKIDTPRDSIIAELGKDSHGLSKDKPLYTFRINDILGYKFIDADINFSHCFLYKDDIVVDLNIMARINKEKNVIDDEFKFKEKILRVDYDFEESTSIETYRFHTTKNTYETTDFIKIYPIIEKGIYDKTTGKSRITIFEDKAIVEFNTIIPHQFLWMDSLILDNKIYGFTKGFLGNYRVVFWSK